MRGHRDFERDDDTKILGRDQMDRLLAWLRARRADDQARALFIVSPVPVVHMSEVIVNRLDLEILGIADDLRDEWGHDTNWAERDKMLDAVFALSHDVGKPVAFLSGDVHIGAAFRLTRRRHPKARVFQLTSSAITYADTMGGILRTAYAHGSGLINML